MGPEEEKAVLDVLRSKRLFRYYGPYSGGSKVDEFEKAFAVQMGTDLVVRFIHMIPRVWPNFGAQSALDGICPGNKRLSRTTSGGRELRFCGPRLWIGRLAAGAGGRSDHTGLYMDRFGRSGHRRLSGLPTRGSPSVSDRRLGSHTAEGPRAPTG